MEPHVVTKTYEVDGYVGCVERRVRRETGLVVGVYRNDQAGLDDSDGEYPWSTVCEPHATVCSHPTLSLALAHAANPLGWCETCMDEARP